MIQVVVLLHGIVLVRDLGKRHANHPAGLDAESVIGPIEPCEFALVENDLKINAPIPFIQLRSEWTKNGKNEVLPLHTALVIWLRGQITGDANRLVFDSIPDMKTVAKDLAAAGVATYTDDPKMGVAVGKGKYINIADGRGRRADFHALRHSFKCSLERARASHTTCKALMRHADSDITDGYSHARLGELAEAVERLKFSPDVWAEAAARTGTYDSASELRVGHGAGHRQHTSEHLAAQSGAAQEVAGDRARESKPSANSFMFRAFGTFAQMLLKVRDDSDKVSVPWPSTQVD